MDSAFLNKFHKQRFELAKTLETSRSRRPSAECIAQYHRIKAGSMRTNPRLPNAERAASA